MADEKYFFISNDTPSEELPQPAAPIDTPEKIVQDLFHAEKEIASETLRLVRSRHGHEKEQWARALAEKENELSAIRTRLSEMEERILNLRRQLDEERQIQLEQTRISAINMEKQRQADHKKWEIIAEKVKDFRIAAQDAHNKYLHEQERAQKIKKLYYNKEKSLNEQLRIKEDELLTIKEQLNNKEELWLRDQSRRDDEIHALQLKTEELEQTIVSERQHHSRIIEKKDTDASQLQNALHETIIQLNIQRKKKEDAEEHAVHLQQRIQSMENEALKLKQQIDQERIKWEKTIHDERQAFEKSMQDYSTREATLKNTLDEKLSRQEQSISLLEQQLNNEQKLRKDAEKNHLNKT